MILPYPLQWPDTLPRTPVPGPSQFKTSLSGALKNVDTSLRAFGRDSGKPVTDIVLTSNVSGLSLGSPKDKGVAAWFTWDGEQRCIAVDRYSKVECNLQAIHHIIEARRTEMRHGGLHIVRQTFKGFTALPAPAGQAPPAPWWIVLDVPAIATAEQIEAAYRARAKRAHPDAGGSNDAMARLNRARQEGLKANG
jgi:hypothetical protein